jgi:hypothetical protein
MANVTKQFTSANHFKKVFDQSLAILCDGARSSRADRRSLPLHIDATNLRSRALGDAATALAALWNIDRSSKCPKLGLRLANE